MSAQVSAIEDTGLENPLYSAPIRRDSQYTPETVGVRKMNRLTSSRHSVSARRLERILSANAPINGGKTVAAADRSAMMTPICALEKPTSI